MKWEPEHLKEGEGGHIPTFPHVFPVRARPRVHASLSARSSASKADGKRRLISHGLRVGASVRARPLGLKKREVGTGWLQDPWWQIVADSFRVLVKEWSADFCLESLLKH